VVAKFPNPSFQLQSQRQRSLSRKIAEISVLHETESGTMRNAPVFFDETRGEYKLVLPEIDDTIKATGAEGQRRREHEDEIALTLHQNTWDFTLSKLT
jgi:hypothetical protein